jgi:hypothetical protein
MGKGGARVERLRAGKRGRGVIGAGRDTDPSDGDFIAFRSAGEAAKGEFRCSACGYGVAVARVLPVCPMCGGSDWEETTWSPFSRAERLH